MERVCLTAYFEAIPLLGQAKNPLPHYEIAHHELVERLLDLLP